MPFGVFSKMSTLKVSKDSPLESEDFSAIAAALGLSDVFDAVVYMAKKRLEPLFEHFSISSFVIPGIRLHPYNHSFSVGGIVVVKAVPIPAVRTWSVLNNTVRSFLENVH
jgi:hypothetical protein